MSKKNSSGTEASTSVNTAIDAETKTIIKIETAVKQWAKAEDSAIWKIIHICHAASQTQASNLVRQDLAQAMKDYMPNMSADSQKVYLSKMYTIFSRCTREQLAKWKKAGTGFYKAYDEVKTPHPESNSNRSWNAGDEHTTEEATIGEDGEIQVTRTTALNTDPVGDVDADTENKQLAAEDRAQSKANKGKVGLSEEDRKDPTQAWEDQINRRSDRWDQLLAHMVDQKSLTVKKVLTCVNAFATTEKKMDDFLTSLINTSEVAKAQLETYLEDRIHQMRVRGELKDE